MFSRKWKIVCLKKKIIIVYWLLFYVYQRYEHLSQNKYWNQIITKTLELFEEVSFQISRYFHSFETKQAGLSLNLKLA